MADDRHFINNQFIIGCGVGYYEVKWEDAPEITHMKPDNRIFGSCFYIGENKQICIIHDYIKYVVRIYIRERENKDAPWSKWELKLEDDL